MKTMAIRLEDDLSAQLTVLGQLEGKPVAELIHGDAITGLIDRKRSEGDLANRAEAVLADIDREAAHRRSAIEALFGEDSPAAAPAKAARGRKAPDATGEAAS